MLYAGLILLSRNLPPDLREGSNDLGIYRSAGEAVLRGEVPYRDFFLEYPPGGLPAFVPPALLSGTRAGFTDLFSSEMALALVVALVLVALTARRAGGARVSWPVPALTFVAGTLLLYPVAATRYDAVVALALATAAFANARAAPTALGAALGFGAAAKLVPALAVLPLVIAQRWRALWASLAVSAVFFVPALVFGGGGFVRGLAYHAERGLQAESVAASVLVALGRVDGVVFEFGAFEVRGPGAGLAAGLSVPVTGFLILITGLAAYRAHRSGRDAAADFPRHAAALILAFMLGSKVLSPQYVVWLLPLVPLAVRPGGRAPAGVVACGLFLAACLTTTLVFPVHYGDLLAGRSPGPELLLARNGLLAALWVFLLLPRGKREVPA